MCRPPSLASLVKRKKKQQQIKGLRSVSVCYRFDIKKCDDWLQERCVSIPKYAGNDHLNNDSIALGSDLYRSNKKSKIKTNRYSFSPY